MEARACKEGLELAIEWVKGKAIVETDCLHLALALKSRERLRSELWYLIQDIKELGSRLPDVEFRAVRREQNCVAHELA